MRRLPAHFTIEFTPAGVSDQLLQLVTLHRIGRALGMDYLHGPVPSERSGAEILRHVGLLDFGPPLADALPSAAAMPAIEVGANLLAEASVEDVAGLLAALRARIEARCASDALPVVALGLREREPLLDLLRREPDALPPAPDMRACFLRAQSGQVRSPFADAPLRLLVHVRQGDSATIRLPLGTVAQVRERYVDLRRGSDAGGGRSHVPVESFVHFTRALQARLPGGHSTCVFSDGFDRAFDPIARWLLRSATPRALLQLAALPWVRAQQARRFRPFEALPATHLEVGERPDALQRLVDAVFHADVIVTGDQQRMMSKLVELYGDRARPPLLYLLESRPDLREQERVLSPGAAELVRIPLEPAAMERALDASLGALKARC